MKEKTIMHASKLKDLLNERISFSDLLFDGVLLGAFGFQTTFENCTFQDCEIKGCYFNNTTYINCSFYGCDLKAIDFSNCEFINCTFTSRFHLCDFENATFQDCTFKHGYIRSCHIKGTKFLNVVFDGIWAGNIDISSPAVFENVTYTMGGARSDEVETAKHQFMFEMGAEAYAA